MPRRPLLRKFGATGLSRPVDSPVPFFLKARLYKYSEYFFVQGLYGMRLKVASCLTSFFVTMSFDSIVTV
jgi:hypothetical protein